MYEYQKPGSVCDKTDSLHKRNYYGFITQQVYWAGTQIPNWLRKVFILVIYTV